MTNDHPITKRDRVLQNMPSNIDHQVEPAHFRSHLLLRGSKLQYLHGWLFYGGSKKETTDLDKNYTTHSRNTESPFTSAELQNPKFEASPLPFYGIKVNKNVRGYWVYSGDSGDDEHQ